MPLDSVTVSALAAELREGLLGARVDKVQQPERDTVLFSLHAPGGNRRLVLCGGVGVARAHLTEASYENPAQPPMFCMLLRKHLVGARITDIAQPGRERILRFELDGFDELGVGAHKTLALEMIGRGTNLILIDGEGRILDCLRRVDSEMNAARQVLPGLIYRLPPAQDKPDFFDLTPEQRRAHLAEKSPGLPPEKWLLDGFSGLSPLVCRELAARCGGDEDRLGACMDALAESVAAGDWAPWMLLEQGKPKDFSFLRVTQYGPGLENRRFPSFSALLDAFYTRRSRTEDLRRRSAELRKTVRNARDRALRKAAAQREELRRTGQREQTRRWADLITANLYRAPEPGAAEMTVEDFYAEGCPAVTVPLLPLKSAKQTAAAYYKDYAKARTAEQYLTRLLAESERDAEYLSGVLDELERAEGEADLAAVRAELTEAGFLRAKKDAKKPREKERAPLRFTSPGGREVLVGRSNLQNDRLTKAAHRGDLWFHVQKLHGSHVILCCAGAEASPEDLAFAASLAAKHSQAAEGGRVPVDYTRVKYVKKPAGALPGMVTYTNQTTLIAEAAGD